MESVRPVNTKSTRSSGRHSSPASSAVSNAASASASLSRSRSALDVFLQTRSYQSPLEAWRNDGSGFQERGFQERVAAANYSFPQASAHHPSTLNDLHRPGSYAAYSSQYPAPTSISKSSASLAPSQYPLPSLDESQSTAYSASQYSYGAPSPVNEGIVLPEGTIDTEFGKRRVQNAGVRPLEEEPHGVLVRPNGGGSDKTTAAGITVYECTFNFLGCRFSTAGDEEHWRTHNISHFHGHVPPLQIECPLCPFGFVDKRDGHRAWAARMSHLAAHMRLGQTLAASRPDFRLYQYLWQKRIIDDAEYKELKGGGTLESVRSEAFRNGPIQTDHEGRHAADQQTRRPLHQPRFPYRDIFKIQPSHTPLWEEQVGYMSEPWRPVPNLTTQPTPTKRKDRKRIVLPGEFLRFVLQEIECEDQLPEVIVLTGTAENAFVTTCKDYLEQTWPWLGGNFLPLLVAALKHLRGYQDGSFSKDILSPSTVILEDKFQFLLHFSRVQHSVLFLSSELDKEEFAFMENIRMVFEVQGEDSRVLEALDMAKWLAAVFRVPTQEKLLASTVIEKKLPNIQFDWMIVSPQPLKEISGSLSLGRCWHKMFKSYVLAEGFPIPERGSQRGVELPFDVMTLLSLVLYPINFGPGIILKGENTALVPSVHEDDPRSVQWHFLEEDSDIGSLSWDTIKESCGSIIPTKNFEELQSRRTFVGYFPKADIHLGTRHSRFDKVDISGAEPDDKTKFTLGNELVGQVGTSVMNFFTAQVSGKIMVHQTAHQRLRGVHKSILDKIRNSKGLPLLLYDVQTKRGWLVPELSAILHLALAWASYQPQPQEVLDKMPFADIQPIGGDAAYEAILRTSDELLPRHIKFEDDLDKQISVLEALTPFFTRISQVKDQQLQRFACGMKETRDLIGYEFREIASFEEHLQARRSSVNTRRSGDWLRLVTVKPDIAVIFCSHLEEPIQLSPDERTCPLWKTVPKDQYYLTASMSCLKYLTKRCGGEENMKLYNDIYCVPGKMEHKSDPCGSAKWPCCSPLLELSKHPSKNLRRFEEDSALIIGRALLPREEHSRVRLFLRSFSSDTPAGLGPNIQSDPNGIGSVPSTLNGVVNASQSPSSVPQRISQAQSSVPVHTINRQ